MSDYKNQFPLCIGNKKNGVKSLQQLCRSSILKTVTIKNIHQIFHLTLPHVVKEFICTFGIPEDFNLDGLFLDYNFNFPNHVHHQTHQVHPGECIFDGCKILIKSEHLTETCKVCDCTGNRTMTTSETREKWASLKHNNLMACHLRMVDQQSKLFCHVLDFPVLSLEDFAFKMFFENKRISEHLIWDVALKLTDVLLYLEENDIYPWELCHPRHVVIKENGDVMLENLLLYLPAKTGSHFQINTCARLSNYASPEHLKGQPQGPQTVIWGLGCILNELSVPFPSTVQNSELFKTNLNQTFEYSATLKNFIMKCMKTNPNARPCLKHLKQIAEKQVLERRRGYHNERSLLDLIPRLKEKVICGEDMIMQSISQ